MIKTLFSFHCTMRSSFELKKKKWNFKKNSCFYQSLFIYKAESITNTISKIFHDVCGLDPYVFGNIGKRVIALSHLSLGLIVRDLPCWIPPCLNSHFLLSQLALWCLLLSGIIFKMRVWEEKRKCFCILHQPLILENFSSEFWDVLYQGFKFLCILIPIWALSSGLVLNEHSE